MEDREQVEVPMTTDPDLETAEDNETPAGEISDDQANLQASSEKQPVTEGPKETENLIKEENEGTDMKIVKSEQGHTQNLQSVTESQCFSILYRVCKGGEESIFSWTIE